MLYRLTKGRCWLVCLTGRSWNLSYYKISWLKFLHTPNYFLFSNFMMHTFIRFMNILYFNCVVFHPPPHSPSATCFPYRRKKNRKNPSISTSSWLVFVPIKTSFATRFKARGFFLDVETDETSPLPSLRCHGSAQCARLRFYFLIDLWKWDDMLV